MNALRVCPNMLAPSAPKPSSDLFLSCVIIVPNKVLVRQTFQWEHLSSIFSLMTLIFSSLLLFFKNEWSLFLSLFVSIRSNCAENIRKHILHTGKHEGVKMYNCPKCIYATNAPMEFRNHLKEHHADIENPDLAYLHAGNTQNTCITLSPLTV